jgi:hypothetical protein
VAFVAGRGRIYRELSGRLKSALGSTAAQTDLSDRKELEQLYLMSLNRNLKLLVVLTGGPLGVARVTASKSSRRYPMCPSRGKAVVEYFRDADHTFTSECVRTRLQELVLGWIKALSS